MSRSTVRMVFGSVHTMAPFILVVVVACFNPLDRFFLTFFKSFQTQVYSLGFSMFLPSVVKSTAHSLCISVRRRNREPGCPPVYNPLTSWNAWPDGSG